MIKKILLSIVFLLSFFSISYAGLDDSFPYKEGDEKGMKGVLQASNMGSINDAFLGEDITNKSSPISYYVSLVINYFLGILGFFAIIILIYGFSQVFTNKTDEGIKKGYTYIKMASIAIIVIGISWLFSTWIFYIYNHQVVK